MNTCAICATDSKDVIVQLCHWRGTKPEYTAEPRCKDVEACRRTVQEQGAAWPLMEAGERGEPR
jgi:hypothetical protein